MPIRIVVIDLPLMLQEIFIETLEAMQTETEVREYRTPVPLLAAVEETDADLVIAAAETVVAAGVAELLEQRPRVKTFAVAADGRKSFLYELRPQKVPLGEVSPQTLAHAVETVARSRFEELLS